MTHPDPALPGLAATAAVPVLARCILVLTSHSNADIHQRPIFNSTTSMIRIRLVIGENRNIS